MKRIPRRVELKARQLHYSEPAYGYVVVGPVIEGELVDDSPLGDNASPEERYKYFLNRVTMDMRNIQSKNVTPR